MVMAWLMWVLLGLGVLAIVLATTGALPRFRGAGRGRAPRRVANSAVLLSSPLVRNRVRRRRALHAALGALVVVGLVAASMMAGRPVNRTVRNNAMASRDIVLCLDVSTSMLTTDVEILDTFSKMLDTFEGERVALVAWNTTAQTMVPLTDDYDLLRDQFEVAADALNFKPTYLNPYEEKYYQTFGGTLLTDVDASSLIGDGLASCSLAFDTKVEDRSRSIVLASDNQVVDPSGLQVYSLSQAADLAGQEDIRLFSLFGSDPTTVDPSLTGMTLPEARNDLRTVTEEHGGFFYEVSDPGARGRDHLREVGAAPDDGQCVRAGLDGLDDGGFVSLVGQERHPVDGAHGDPTGTAARESAEVWAARRAGTESASARISMRCPRCVWEDEASMTRTKVKVPSISRAWLSAWFGLRAGVAHSRSRVPSATPSGRPALTVTATRSTEASVPLPAASARSSRMMSWPGVSTRAARLPAGTSELGA